VGQSCIIFGCLSIITGLILIVVGIISEVKKTTFVGIGIISLGGGLFLTTLVCFYGKLNICYNNWAYRSRVLPVNPETPHPTPAGVAAISPFTKSTTATQNQHSTIPLDTQSPITVVSEADIHKLVISQSININTTTNNPENVT
jgi:hypothetical protein